MCGIFGYIGKKDPVKIVIDGLKCLEYRGYDSAGIAGIKDGAIYGCKEVGKVSILENEVLNSKLQLDIAIAHTRWATHGEPTEKNAHPHFDSSHSLALVHNGIIENHAELKSDLMKSGVVFESDTDTEVIAHLVAKNYHGDILEAVQKTLPLLQGAYAIAIVHKDHPDKIIAVAHESPMIIGIGQDQAFISSDSHAFAPHTREVVFLSNSEVAVVRSDKLEVFNSNREPISKEKEQLSYSGGDVSKGEFEHFTLKEIYEQPQTIKNAFASRFVEEYGTAHFDGLLEHSDELHAVKRILILACGTSWHAGLVASYIIEKCARIPVQVEISSEFRYKNPIIASDTLVIAISQSGETADTIAVIREIKEAKGVKIFSLCNVLGSTLVRESDYTFFLHAGPEIGVCSTKAFTSQLVILSLFALQLGRMRHLTKEEGQDFLTHLKMLPSQVQSILDNADAIKTIAKKYAHYENFFFIGRQYMYPISLEGALKLKEISYINAVGYPAGEMKHGPIALINEKCPTVALCANKATFDKIQSNLMEVKARKGPIIAVIEEGQKNVEAIANDVIVIPETIDEFSSITTTIVTQLLAYYIALERGTEIDQPRNLAKSVTVE
ncbi:MAG: glutamine--fructose-6-phosphate transaminase (isomerizing) [Chlamydiota bacterium]|nr:glutamine--fructose-6-phosphate transaminase (isomerizing) [Chlamydiota bacterium]